MGWKISVDVDRPQMTVWRTRIASWIPKATNTQSGYVIPSAFPLPQWFQKIVSLLRYTYFSALLSHNYGILICFRHEIEIINLHFEAN
jgi:hypothetical protein